MDKDTASARISRYESESMAISLESLFELALALDVPPAYLLASSPAMANAILALGEHNEAQQVRLAEVLEKLSELPPKKRNVLIEQLSHLTKEEQFRRTARLLNGEFELLRSDLHRSLRQLAF